MKWLSELKSHVKLSRLVISSILLGILICFQAPNQGDAGDGNLVSVWLKMSASGYSQAEIESVLSNIEPAKVQEVKHMLRMLTLEKLKNMGLAAEIRRSETLNDLRGVQDRIWTEIRFSGLDNDHHVRMLIQNHFGVDLSAI